MEKNFEFEAYRERFGYEALFTTEFDTYLLALISQYVYSISKGSSMGVLGIYLLVLTIPSSSLCLIIKWPSQIFCAPSDMTLLPSKSHSQPNLTLSFSPPAST
jgi:hypothetical protein